MKQHTGILGGSFDPIHLGHLNIAKAACDHLQLTALRFLPCAMPALKPQTQASSEDRINMLELALATEPDYPFSIDTRELERDGPSYLIDSLTSIRAELGQTIALSFILGLDAYLELPQWKAWQQLLEHCHLVVASRPGYDWSMLQAPLADMHHKHLCADPAALSKQPRGYVYILPHAERAISSSELRLQSLGANALPAPVYAYIQEHALYQ